MEDEIFESVVIVFIYNYETIEQIRTCFPSNSPFVIYSIDNIRFQDHSIMLYLLESSRNGFNLESFVTLEDHIIWFENGEVFCSKACKKFSFIIYWYIHMCASMRFSSLYYLRINHLKINRNIIFYNVIEPTRPNKTLILCRYHLKYIKEKSNSGFKNQTF